MAAAIALTIPIAPHGRPTGLTTTNDGGLDVYATDRAGDNKLFQNRSGRFTHAFVGVGPTDARP